MPPTPQSNVEKYLHAIAGHGGEIPSEPLSRVEYYLDEIAKSGGIGGKLRPEIVSALPTTGETGILYLVPSQGSGRNLCDEYFWIEDESRFELLGQTTVEVDLSGYVPNSRKVGGKSLTNDIGITISGTGAIEVTDNGTSSAVAFDISHKDSGVTAGSKGDTTNQTPGFGETFKTLSVTVDTKGHVTALSERNVKIPDTKVTTSMDGLMSKEDKVKLDKYASKGSATKGVYIDASGSPQSMTHELNADVPANFAPATAAPLIDGTAAVGTSARYAREDHKHPTDTSRASADDVTAQGNRITALEAENALLRELVNGIDAPIYRAASGNPATFADGYAANVKALSVTITPTQSGSGDPSPDNIRPISGVTSVSVTRTGRNLLPQTVTETATINASESGNVIYTPLGAGRWKAARGNSSTGYAQLMFANKIPIENTTLLAGQSYYLTGIPSNVTGGTRITALAYASDGKTVLSGANYSDPATPAAFAIPQNTAFVSAYFSYSATQQGEVVFSPMLRSLSDTDTTYEAYQEQSVTVSLVDSNNPLTVYGGTLNVTTGELTVTWKYVGISSAKWTYSADSNVFYSTDFSDKAPGYANIVSDTYNTVAVSYLNNLPDGCIRGNANTSTIYIRDDRHGGVAADFKAGATNTHILYELRAPVTYQLTPAQIATLSGYNSVTTDAGTLSVTYHADTALSFGNA